MNSSPAVNPIDVSASFTMARSVGHMCFTSDGAFEFFLVGQEVFRAPTSAPLCDARDTRRHGRFAASLKHFMANITHHVW